MVRVVVVVVLVVAVVVVVGLQVGGVRGGEHGVGRVRRPLMLALERRAAQDELRAVGLRQGVLHVAGAVAAALVAALALLLEHEAPPLGARVLEPHLQHAEAELVS